MRATEFIDFLNSKNLKNVDQYSHFDPSKINDDGKRVLKTKFKNLRLVYKKTKGE
jgi:hypothetical protein|tara:strand:- start:42 stop:206 length:165 start_codon:yes stop_codon:yes gene_type:complete